MKKYLFLILGCLGISNLFSQQPNVIISYDNIVIPIYRDAINNDIDYRIMQDTINELFFGLTILENSPLRFKVAIQSVTGSTPCPEIIGWIDKGLCGVFKRWYYDQENRAYVKLYSEPNQESPFTKIYDNLEISGEQIFTVCDYAPNNWVKVVFYCNNILYVGWIDKYCSNVYNSCT